ncbi:hypothetical protein D3C85_1921420 [compost metagenome]
MVQYPSSKAAMPNVLANWLDIRKMSLQEINFNFTLNELQFLIEHLWIELDDR